MTFRVFQMAALLVAVPALILGFAACTPGLASREDSDRPATAAKIFSWRKERGFVEANDTEIAEAKRMERRFANQRALSPDGKCRVVFRGGVLVGDFQHGASTTSIYQLVDASGRVLLTAPSRITRTEYGEPIEHTQLAWFSPDDSKVLVYEHLRECNGPAPLAILFFQDPENPREWSVRFPDLGDTLNAPFDEGDHAECRGLLHEEILIRNTHMGISKIRIDRLKNRHPFPFTIG